MLKLNVKVKAENGQLRVEYYVLRTGSHTVHTFFNDNFLACLREQKGANRLPLLLI